MSACPHLRRPAPGQYFHPLFLIFQIPPPSGGGNQNLLPLSELCEQRVDEFDVDGEYDCWEAFALNNDTVFELVEPETYVGMRSPRNAIQSFFIAEVQNY